MRLCVVVAPNGLGHFRRVVRLLHALLLHQTVPLEVTVIAEQWQRDATRGWACADALFERVKLASGVMSPGVGWSSSPETFDDGRLQAWEERLAALPAFREATHVWSDNLAGVLGLRADAFLSGSFLWSDVLEVHRTAAVLHFVDRERDLLAKHRPWMLAVRPLVMRGVEARTRAVLVPWMCEWHGGAASERKRVGALGGRSGAAAERLGAVAQRLSERFEVSRDDALTHDATGYGSLAAAVLRPGAGSVTDCVASAVPMLLLDESENPEMAHNASAVQALGLGRILPRAEEIQAIAWIEEMTDSQARKAYAKAFAAQRTDGLAVAAEWLFQHLNLEKAR